MFLRSPTATVVELHTVSHRNISFNVAHRWSLWTLFPVCRAGTHNLESSSSTVMQIFSLLLSGGLSRFSASSSSTGHADTGHPQLQSPAMRCLVAVAISQNDTTVADLLASQHSRLISHISAALTAEYRNRYHRRIIGIHPSA